MREFIQRQLAVWPLAGANFQALDKVQVKTLVINGLQVDVQFNPARMVSSAAKTDRQSLSKRPCFLCPHNRPREQFCIPFTSSCGHNYDLLVNPYPIFPDHLVIAFGEHSVQSINDRYSDLLDLCSAYSDYTFFYNGPHCGASAPDHHHFQGTGQGRMPLENDVNLMIDEGTLLPLYSDAGASISHYGRFTRGVFVIRAGCVQSSERMFRRLVRCSPAEEDEPRFNIISYCRKGEYVTLVIYRSSHRSHHYYSLEEDHLTMSPGCVDMAGVFIVPVREEFDKLDAGLLRELLDEVSIKPEDEKFILDRLSAFPRKLRVGIMSAPKLLFKVDGVMHSASFRDGKVELDGKLHDKLYFHCLDRFSLSKVTIGMDFHWERKRDLAYGGDLEILPDEDKLVAVNVIDVEDYLMSVISSEMNPKADEEFLKAHAVISRSWVLARMQGGHSSDESSLSPSSDEIVRWYGTADHKLFDVCADDHCQRYQGLSMITDPKVRRVTDATRGEVLCYDGKICDARFSKCCGGRMELFSTCWEDRDYPYLQALADVPQGGGEPFCKVADETVLSQILNDYDRQTTDFFEWEQKYSTQELSSLISRKSGRDIGQVQALEPLHRGPSGRISRLLVKGSKSSFIVGKELEIRKILSTSHLKSSNFTATFKDGQVTLHGYGWGHGVGLCQIGAAVMASKGFNYREILAHYYPGTTIRTI